MLKSFYHLTLFILSQFEFILSVENDVMATSKRFFSLIFTFKQLAVSLKKDIARKLVK